MGFTKAKSQQRYLRVAVYGKQGSGKTFTTLLWAEPLAEMEKKRTAMWQTERGADFYTKPNKARAIHPEAFDFDADHGKSFVDAKKVILAMDPKIHGVMIVDSTTELWNSLVTSYDKDRLPGGTLPIWVWGKIKPTWRSFLDELLNLQAHVFILGREGREYGEDEDTGKETILGAKFKAEAETGYEANILVQMLPVRNAGKKKGEIRAFFEKDRASVMHQRTVRNPVYKNSLGLIVPYLDLKSAHVRRETSEEAARKDVEGLAGQEQAKEDGSREIVVKFSTKISEARDRKTLTAIRAQITPKVKKGMTPADLASLRKVYQSRWGSMDEQKKTDAERVRLITEIDAVKETWDAESWDNFTKRVLYDRTPEWPAGCANVDLRALMREIVKMDTPPEEPKAEKKVNQGTLA